MDIFYTAVSSIIPIFFLILLGILLRKVKAVNDDFITKATRIVFNYALPVLVFQKMLNFTGFSRDIAAGLLVYFFVIILVTAASWLIMKNSPSDVRSSVVQGSFRGNIAIIGLAVIESLFGGLETGYFVVLVAAAMPVHNFMAIIVLDQDAKSKGFRGIAYIGKNLVRNPIIWGTAAGAVCNLLGIVFPEPVNDSLTNLSSLTLPLALIGIGGSLRLRSLVHGMKYWSFSSFMKLVTIPVCIFLISRALSLDEAVLRVLVIAGAGPAAIGCYVMAEGFGADARLAGEIITVTTLASTITITLWAMVLL